MHSIKRATAHKLHKSSHKSAHSRLSKRKVSLVNRAKKEAAHTTAKEPTKPKTTPKAEKTKATTKAAPKATAPAASSAPVASSAVPVTAATAVSSLALTTAIPTASSAISGLSSTGTATLNSIVSATSADYNAGSPPKLSTGGVVAIVVVAALVVVGLVAMLFRYKSKHRQEQKWPNVDVKEDAAGGAAGILASKPSRPPRPSAQIKGGPFDEKQSLAQNGAPMDYYNNPVEDEKYGGEHTIDDSVNYTPSANPTTMARGLGPGGPEMSDRAQTFSVMLDDSTAEAIAGATAGATAGAAAAAGGAAMAGAGRRESRQLYPAPNQPYQPYQSHQLMMDQPNSQQPLGELSHVMSNYNSNGQYNNEYKGANIEVLRDGSSSHLMANSNKHGYNVNSIYSHSGEIGRIESLGSNASSTGLANEWQQIQKQHFGNDDFDTISRTVSPAAGPIGSTTIMQEMNRGNNDQLSSNGYQPPRSPAESFTSAHSNPDEARKLTPSPSKKEPSRQSSAPKSILKKSTPSMLGPATSLQDQQRMSIIAEESEDVQSPQPSYQPSSQPSQLYQPSYQLQQPSYQPQQPSYQPMPSPGLPYMTDPIAAATTAPAPHGPPSPPLTPNTQERYYKPEMLKGQGQAQTRTLATDAYESESPPGAITNASKMSFAPQQGLREQVLKKPTDSMYRSPTMSLYGLYDGDDRMSAMYQPEPMPQSMPMPMPAPAAQQAPTQWGRV